MGEEDFLTIHGSGKPRKTCNECHTSNSGPGSDRLLFFLPPQPIKVSQLRNAYQKLLYTRHNADSIDGFGMEHDGNISIPSDLLDQPIFRFTRQQKTDMTAYLCFDTGTAPAVGYTTTLTAANVNNQQEQSDWADAVTADVK
jgi:hypothetical protein